MSAVTDTGPEAGLFPLRLVIDGWGRIASADRDGHFIGRPLLAWLVSDLSLSADDAAEVNESALLVANGQVHGFRTRLAEAVPGCDVCVSISTSSKGSVLDITAEPATPVSEPPPTPLSEPPPNLLSAASSAQRSHDVTGGPVAPAVIGSETIAWGPRRRRVDPRAELLETLGLADQMLAALDESSDLVAIADARGHRWRYLNRAARLWAGIGEEQTLDGLRFGEFMPVQTEDHIRDVAMADLVRDGRWEGEIVLHRAGGGEGTVHVVMLARRDDAGIVVQTTMIGHEVGKQDPHDRRTEPPDDAHDPLTGLANRAAMLDMIERAVQEGGDDLAVLCIDLDDFKVMNDRYGSDAGDELLVAVSRRMSHLLRSGDRIGRVGGDEFLVVCRCADGETEARRIGDRLAAVLVNPFALAGGLSLVCRASIGVALGRSGIGAAELVGHSDLAMFHAKELGKSRVVFYGDRVIAAALRGAAFRR